ncbi:hypothetical protein EW146_g4111 [Bondarzewia mesenterica]|uniref:NADP-dependent oxidoreductase domain-containing protein n=1 Tax=Bondarzewia mesenterica TaxID=1095465 RepID=A0A4V3XF94_9AGAM|nr:hypothetical protein EW146_g4111 [Bondarzewia mesenterica]
MVLKTAKIGGAASAVVVGRIGHGLMMMTWKPTPVPDEEAFEALKAGMDSLPEGAKMLINSAEFYGMNPMTANLELVSRFFEKYPTYADKAFLSVKGGTKADSIVPDGSADNLKRSVDTIIKTLQGKKRLDLFEPARVDPKYSIEDTIKVLAGFVAEGKFDYIGLSECRAETVRRANTIAPVACVEIEVSPWSYMQETKNVIATCEELGIAVVAYSPLGRGFLTGQIKKPDDFEGKSFQTPPFRVLTSSSKRNLKHNFAIVDALKLIADKKGITTAQLSLAWVASRGPHVIPLPGSSYVFTFLSPPSLLPAFFFIVQSEELTRSDRNKKRTLENVAAGDVELSPEELAEIDKVLQTHTVKGGRYIDEVPDEHLLLWG